MNEPVLRGVFHVLRSADNLAKAIWVVVILVLPVLGLLVWLLFGPRAGS
jgi:hypothetical protein